MTARPRRPSFEEWVASTLAAAAAERKANPDAPPKVFFLWEFQPKEADWGVPGMRSVIESCKLHSSHPDLAAAVAAAEADARNHLGGDRDYIVRHAHTDREIARVAVRDGRAAVTPAPDH